MRRFLPFAALVAGAFAGFLISSPGALASRNSSGTYSLPSSPVVSGTPVSSSNENSFRSDVATEFTDSLSRSGKGGMSAPLQHSDGTVALPSITFGSDPDTGLYRIGANNIGLACGGTKVVDYSTTGVAVTGTFSSSGAMTASSTLGVTGATTLTGAATLSSTLAVTGASTLTGLLTANGAITAAKTSGDVITATAATSGKGIVATGAGTSVGGQFANGTAATGGTRQDAVVLTNGDLNMDGVTAATKTTAVKNRLTPGNIIKAWGRLTVTGSGGTSASCVVTDGFNVASCTSPTSALINVTMAQAMANTTYAVVAMGDTSASTNSAFVEQGNQRTTSVVGLTTPSGVINFWTNGQVASFQFLVIGTQ